MHNTHIPLGKLTPQQFLNEYWQKKPLVIRQAFPKFQCPITADELAGLSCEEEVDSRIIIEKDGEHPWQPIFGPMSENTFSTLPRSHWTLAINDLEKVMPEFAWIPDCFDFIPNWRFDDLLCSYAADQGSVGPHFDLYDVFIIQAEGQRRWQISTAEVTEDNQVNETPLRIQKTFNAEQEWILEPGDMIYIPPNVSHHGVSLGESMSFSVGYRAASHADLLSDFIAHITQNLSVKLTYQDADLKVQSHSSEITPEAIQRIKNIFKDYLNPEHKEIENWFGQYMSDPKSEYTESPNEPLNTFNELITEIDIGASLSRHPASRFTFIKKETQANLFIDGDTLTTSLSFASALCDSRIININLLNNMDSSEQQLILDLYNSGKVHLT
ncbi:FIG002776: hypothetical protein [hydrothermal vent metagenome]|uniref:JmjC domain-containing protein n=1 Tax=hydrothermal vent metagenome TaxID=652676 RepID=A0A3B0XN00_9ZZZZ